MPMVDCKMFTYFSEILCASRNEQIIQINGKSREGWGHKEMAHASCFAPATTMFTSKTWIKGR